MLNEARADMVIAPHVAIFPSLAIFITVLAFNLLGDGLRDALDPKLKGEGIAELAYPCFTSIIDENLTRVCYRDEEWIWQITM